MEITLNGIPISEEQCIGDSLPYINAAFISLKNAIIESSELNNSSYLKISDFIGFYPTTGGTIFGGVQVGGPGINSGAVLRFGKTLNSSDGELVESLPTILCSSSNAIGNDLFINTNSANGKILLRTGTPTVRTNALILDSNGNANIASGNVCIGSTAIASQKLEVFNGNIKISSPAVPTLILNNNITNSLQWSSKIQFTSNNVAKYELGVDPTSTGINQFYIYDSATQQNRFIVRNDGKVYIPGNVGIGTEPVSNRSLKVAGDLEVGAGLSILGSFSTSGITASGPIVGVAGSFSGKLTTTSLEGIQSSGPIIGTSYSGGPISGTTGTFSGKITTTSNDGIQSSGPITGSAFTGTSYTGGPISGTTGTFSGKITTTSNDGIQSAGPIAGTSGSFTGKLVTTSNLGIESSGPLSATAAAFNGRVSTNELNCAGPVTGINGSFTGALSGASLLVLGNVTGAAFTGTGYSGGPISGTTGTYTGRIVTTSTNGIDSAGPITATGYSGGPISGTTGTYTGKITTTSTNGIDSAGPIIGTSYTGGPISGTTGTYTGKITTTSTSGIESAGPIAGTGYSGGSISGTTGTFSGKIRTTSLDGIESSGPIVGTTGSFTTITGTGYSGGIVSGTTGTFSDSLSTYGDLVGQEARSQYAWFQTATIGDAYVTSDFKCTQAVTTSLSSSGIVIFDNSLTVKSGSTYLGGSAQVTNTLSVTGITTIQGDLTVTGAISSDSDIIAFQTSDIRLKKNITPISGALDKVSNIRGCEFEWDETLAEPHLKGKSAGFIAQEVEAVFPQAVIERENGYKAIRYEYILPLLLEAVKDLQDEVEDLKTKLKT